MESRGLDLGTTSLQLSGKWQTPDLALYVLPWIQLSVHAELCEKIESRGESLKIWVISPDVLKFQLEFLHPIYQAQRELEGDLHPTLNLVA